MNTHSLSDTLTQLRPRAGAVGGSPALVYCRRESFPSDEEFIINLRGVWS